MGSALPLGEPVPSDGSFPAGTPADPRTAFGVYLHVPFCRVRCGYCDFNTYTSAELGGGASQAGRARLVAMSLSPARQRRSSASAE